MMLKYDLCLSAVLGNGTNLVYNCKSCINVTVSIIFVLNANRCAVGNCFALRKDHETALKNFQRAVQLDSRVAYAHTLCGHEYVLPPIIIDRIFVFE